MAPLTQLDARPDDCLADVRLDSSASVAASATGEIKGDTTTLEDFTVIAQLRGSEE